MQPCVLRYDVNVRPVATRKQGFAVAILDGDRHQMLHTVSHICTNVEAALVWFGGITYAIVRGRSFLTAPVDDEYFTETYTGVYVDDREHGLMLMHMGFTP